MEKRIRFGDLVRTAGRPQTFALWAAPEDNPQLNAARKQNRVLTVVQEPTSKHKDYGLIGFHPEPHAVYLLFPRALPREDGRVIGLNYDLIDEPPVPDPARLAKAPKHARESTHTKPEKATPRKPERAASLEKEFTFTIRRTATLETKVAVKARNRKIAKQEAFKSAKEQPFDMSAAVLHESIIG